MGRANRAKSAYNRHWFGLFVPGGQSLGLAKRETWGAQMFRQSNQKYRKPDFLMVLVTLVGVALAATVTLHVHALSSVRSNELAPMLTEFKSCSRPTPGYTPPPEC